MPCSYRGGAGYCPSTATGYLNDRLASAANARCPWRVAADVRKRCGGSTEAGLVGELEALSAVTSLVAAVQPCLDRAASVADAAADPQCRRPAALVAPAPHRPLADAEQVSDLGLGQQDIVTGHPDLPSQRQAGL
jgi:hypothetical protein